MNKYTLSKPRRWVLALLITCGLVISAFAYPLLHSERAETTWQVEAIACGPQAGGGGGGGC